MSRISWTGGKPVLPSDEEKPFKEILYLLLEQVRATKAALYLLEPGGSFALLTQYGFGRADRLTERVQRTDPLAVAVHEKREPTYVNDILAAGRLTELMEAARSTRILTAPLTLDGRIVGLLDVRDKAGRVPFGSDDLETVNEVLRRLAQRASALERFSGPVAGEAETPRGTAGANRQRPPGAPPETPWNSPPSAEIPLDTAFLPTGTARAQRLVEEVLSRSGAPAREPVRSHGPRELGLFKHTLEACLAFPGVEAAAVTAVRRTDALVTVDSRVPLHEKVEHALIENVDAIFAGANVAFPMPEARSLQPMRLYPPEATPLTVMEVASIQSSVLLAGADDAVILSLVMRPGPWCEDRDAHRGLHALVKASLGEVREAARYRDSFRGLVNKLLEPGLKRFGQLRNHSFAVARMARHFALHLGLSPIEVEQLTVAGILHDVGMKELNYDELYKKTTLTDEERKLLKEHPRVGAFLISDVPWPYEVVALVRHHHERWDGQGYPDGLAGTQIPLGARMIHLCEAFDAMTSPTSYRAMISVPQALEILVGKGGTQFDPELAPAFKKMVEGLKPE